MSGGYVVYDPSEMGELRSQLRDLRDSVAELQAPTGTQTAEALQTLTDLVEGLLEQTNLAVTNNITAGGNITAQGDVTGNSVFAQTINTNITATRVAVWGRTSDGFLGTATSSEKRKANIRPLDIDPEAVLSIEPVYYQWIEQLQERERRANMSPDDPDYLEDMHVSTEVGMIAERLHEAGLWQFVVYARNPDDTVMLNEDGEAVPDGIHYVNWGVALQVVARYLASQMAAMQADISELKAALGLTA